MAYFQPTGHLADFFEDVLGYHAVTVDNRKILTIQPAKNRKIFSGILTRKYP